MAPARANLRGRGQSDEADSTVHERRCPPRPMRSCVIALLALATAPAAQAASSPEATIAPGIAVQGILASADAAALDASHERSGPGFARAAHRFHAARGETVRASLLASFDAYLILEGPDGRVLAENNDEGGLTSSQLTATLASAGVHRLIVTSSAPGFTGSYALRLDLVQAAPVAAEDLPLVAGRPVHGTLAAGDMAWLPSNDVRAGPGHLRDGYRFAGQAGEPVFLALTSDFDAALYLLDGEGTIVEFNHDNLGPSGQTLAPGDVFSSRQSQIAALLRETGEHRVVVTSYGPSVTGSYTLTLITTGGASPMEPASPPRL